MTEELPGPRVFLSDMDLAVNPYLMKVIEKARSQWVRDEIRGGWVSTKSITLYGSKGS